MKVLLILFIVCMIFSSIGWKKFVYFISIGYGYSIAACGICIAILYCRQLSWLTALLCLLLVIYGCRLGTFILLREIKSASYRKEMKDLTKTSKPITVGASFSIWFSVALLYVMEVSPVAFRMENALSDTWGWIGAGVMALGILTESTADAQKSASKKRDPNRFVDTGLYRLVRCPNYLGEILFWTGCFISGIGCYQHVWQFIFTLIGYLSIVYIMFGGARRLELRQNRNYGDREDYQAYVKSTPIIIPFVPLYSVAKQTWLKG